MKTEYKNVVGLQMNLGVHCVSSCADISLLSPQRSGHQKSWSLALTEWWSRSPLLIYHEKTRSIWFFFVWNYSISDALWVPPLDARVHLKSKARVRYRTPESIWGVGKLSVTGQYFRHKSVLPVDFTVWHYDTPPRQTMLLGVSPPQHHHDRLLPYR